MKLRNIVTPLTMAAFLAIALTGLALFFHIGQGLVHEAHEWLGVFFAGIVLWHGGNHWRSMLAYTRRRSAVAAFLLVVVAAVGLTAATGKPETGGPRAVLEALTRQPVTAIAPAFGLTPAQAVSILRAQGIAVVDGQPLAELAKAAQIPEVALLGLLANGHAGTADDAD